MIELNQSQSRAVTSKQSSILVVAGPGSGKTRVLAARIEWLVTNGAKPDRIVAITFTNAAANELRNRLGGTAGYNVGYCGTLHSYILDLLKTYGHSVLGLPKKIAVVDEETAESVLDEVCREQNYKGSEKDLRVALQTVPSLEPRRVLAGADLVSSAYHARLFENGLFDFNSILAYGLHLLRTYGEKMLAEHGVIPLLADHLLVDEFQDSGDMDAQLYEALPVANRFYVGDPDQSIYAFRGGNPSHMLRAARNFSQWVTYYLFENYRSCESICFAADRLIRRNPGRLPKAITAKTSEYGKITVSEFENEHAEARALATELVPMSEEELNNCAVLVRTNRLVEYFSNSMVVPVRRKVNLDLPTDWRAARQMVAFLANPENDILAYRELFRIRGKEVADRVKREAASDLTSINQYALHVRGLDVGSVPEALARGLIQPLSIERVEKAIAGLASPSLANLTLALADMDLHTEEEGSGVTVCTIHAAKGREWDRVYMPAMNQEIIPGGDATQLEEMRRLAFVGVTRARKSLWLSWAKRRKRHAHAMGLSECNPSQFIAELTKLSV